MTFHRYPVPQELRQVVVGVVEIDDAVLAVALHYASTGALSVVSEMVLRVVCGPASAMLIRVGTLVMVEQ